MSDSSQIIDAELRFNHMKDEFENGWKTSHMDIRDYILPTRGHYDQEAMKVR